MTKGACVPELSCTRELLSKWGYLFGDFPWIRNKLLCKPTDILGLCTTVALMWPYIIPIGGFGQKKPKWEESQDKKQVQHSMGVIQNLESTKHMCRVSCSLTVLLDNCRE